MEAGEEGDGDEDDDCFLAVADFELWGEERVLADMSFASDYPFLRILRKVGWR